MPRSGVLLAVTVDAALLDPSIGEFLARWATLSPNLLDDVFGVGSYRSYPVPILMTRCNRWRPQLSPSF